MTTQEAILEKNYKNYKKRITYSQNVLKAMEEYGKYCAEQAWIGAFGVIKFSDWWSEFIGKEATE